MSIIASDIIVYSKNVTKLLDEILAGKEIVKHDSSDDLISIRDTEKCFFLRKNNLLIKNESLDCFPEVLDRLRANNDRLYFSYFNDSDGLIFCEIKDDNEIRQICHPRHHAILANTIPGLFRSEINTEVFTTSVEQLPEIWSEKYMEVAQFSYLIEGNEYNIDPKQLDKVVVCRVERIEVFTRKTRYLSNRYASLIRHDMNALSRAVKLGDKSAIPTISRYLDKLENELTKAQYDQKKKNSISSLIRSVTFDMEYLKKGENYLAYILNTSDDENMIDHAMRIIIEASIPGFNTIIREAVRNNRLDIHTYQSAGIILYLTKHGTIEDIELIDQIPTRLKVDVEILDRLRKKIIKQGK